MEARRPRRGFRGGQLLGIIPIDHAPAFLAALHDVATDLDVTFLSMGSEAEIWAKPALSPEQWSRWDEQYEKLCKELGL
jgi:hypothetical protein